jgi:hypothetical protein
MECWVALLCVSIGGKRFYHMSLLHQSLPSCQQALHCPLVGLSLRLEGKVWIKGEGTVKEANSSL